MYNTGSFVRLRSNLLSRQGQPSVQSRSIGNWPRIYSKLFYPYYEGADRVRGRGEKRGREEGEEGREEGEGRTKGREGEKGKFCGARSARRSRREEGDKGAGGGR